MQDNRELIFSPAPHTTAKQLIDLFTRLATEQHLSLAEYLKKYHLLSENLDELAASEIITLSKVERNKLCYALISAAFLDVLDETHIQLLKNCNYYRYPLSFLNITYGLIGLANIKTSYMTLSEHCEPRSSEETDSFIETLNQLHYVFLNTLLKSSVIGLFIHDSFETLNANLLPLIKKLAGYSVYEIEFILLYFSDRIYETADLTYEYNVGSCSQALGEVRRSAAQLINLDPASFHLLTEKIIQEAFSLQINQVIKAEILLPLKLQLLTLLMGQKRAESPLSQLPKDLIFSIFEYVDPRKRLLSAKPGYCSP